MATLVKGWQLETGNTDRDDIYWFEPMFKFEVFGFRLRLEKRGKMAEQRKMSMRRTIGCAAIILAFAVLSWVYFTFGRS